MKKYYLHDGTSQKGPFSISDLKDLQINYTTPIWYEGLNDWTEAQNIEEIKSDILDQLPPPYQKKITPPSYNPNNIQATKIPEKKKSKWNFWHILQILAGIFLLGLIITYFVNKSNYSSSQEIPATYEDKVKTVAEIEKESPSNFLSADGTYRPNLLGNKYKIDCIVTNKATAVTYKDAVIQITFYSKTNTPIATKEYTIYETFPPNSTQTFNLKVDRYDDVSSLGWEVISAKVN